MYGRMNYSARTTDNEVRYFVSSKRTSQQFNEKIMDMYIRNIEASSL